MSVNIPERAMVFAAGLGTRMRDFAPDIPKPLVSVAGKPLIDHTLDHLALAGVKQAVVNVAYKGRQIIDHVRGRTSPEVIFSVEEEPLETGGGIRNALPKLGNEPFLCVNTDVIWDDGTVSALHRLAEAFDPSMHDAALLVCPLAQSLGYSGDGDFYGEGNHLRRPNAGELANVVFTGIQILHPRLFREGLFSHIKEDKFSLSMLYKHEEGDSDMADGHDWFPRMVCVVHDSMWLHIGDAKGVAEAESYLSSASLSVVSA